MKVPLFLLTVVVMAAATLFSGCATTPGSQARYKVSPASPPREVSFSVLGFSTKDAARQSQTDRGIREFEAIYFPARIVSSLRSLPEVSAYYAMAESPATDFVVNGMIVGSDGKRITLQVTMTRVDGSAVFAKTFAINNEDARERVLKPKMDQFFVGIARELVAKARTTPVNLKEARAKAYAEDGNLGTTPVVLEHSEVAGSIERESILTPLTASLLPRAEIASQVYTQWQTQVIPLHKEQELARNEKSLARTGSMIALVGGAASVAQGYQSAQQGNQQGLRHAQQEMVKTGVRIAETGAVYQRAANQERAIEEVLSTYKAQFTSGLPRQITVRIYDKLVTLSGSQQEMLSTFRGIVKEKLNSPN